MAYTPLPPRPHLDWLRKRAKARLADLRRAKPATRLYEAQLQIAREHDFPSWRALKAHVDRVNQEGRFKADGTPSHLPAPDLIDSWPDFTPEAPLRVMVSGCLAGKRVGVDGGTNGKHEYVQRFLALPNVAGVGFCPEAFALGVPRAMPDIHGGDGFDVLDGRARVFAATGEDWTEGMLAGARQMLRLAQVNQVRLAILMDISAACGSQVIYRGPRASSPHQIGQGVAAALLIRNGIPVVSQRDFRTLTRIYRKVDPAGPAAGDIDHHEIDWYRGFFGSSPER